MKNDISEQYFRAYPASFEQQRLWFIDQLKPNISAYNINTSIRLVGHLDEILLEECLNEIVRRHESLRTTFKNEAGHLPVQVIAPSLSIEMPVIDLSALPEGGRETGAQRLAKQAAALPFDLETGPLARFQLLHLAARDHMLLLTIHHIIFDGWSMSVLLRELSALYSAYAKGQLVHLPELPIQYADYAIWQRDLLRDEMRERLLSYWKKQLADLPVLELPTERPRGALQTFRGAQQYLDIPRALTDGLKALSQQNRCTLFMTLLAAFQTLLHRYSGQDDIVIGIPFSVRDRPETNEIIGCFVNSLVLRTDVAGDPRFTELLTRVREVCFGAYAHRDLPFEQVVEELRPERDMDRNPLFQVMFVFQNSPAMELDLPSLSVEFLPIESGMAKFDLTLDMSEGPDGLRGTLEYNTDLFDAATIQRMGGHFQTLLEGIVTAPEVRLSELPLLTVAERRELLVEWNDTAADFPGNRCIHQLFDDQAARSPEAVALIYEDRQLTYGELNARANQLAHYLRTLGVLPEVLVGLCMERSLELVVGVLGILKAGGAYVPLDPTYPKERLAFMLQDSGAPVVVTLGRLASALPPFTGAVVCLDSEWPVISAESPDSFDLLPLPTAENLAYVMYT
ncbi:condensation domain-containing protein, partial [Methylosinus sp. R-45379]|uniref:condensation domain-containing protein n=1 Tax=Methylosinus sp. R-45379 TaxID=980563 RepID=UPI0018DD9A7B